MEFRCRLASPNGEIVEGVYVAESEGRLRHELEEKGLFVLSLQPKHAIAGVSLQCRSAKASPLAEGFVREVLLGMDDRITPSPTK